MCPVATFGVMKQKPQNDKEIVRVAFRLHGAELAQVREVQEMLNLNSELDASRYLMTRGLEAMSATLASRKASLGAAAHSHEVLNLEKMFETLQKLEARGKEGK